jgi:hypothetical protein
MKHSLGDTSQDALLESAFYGLLTEVKTCKVKPEAMGITRMRACVRWVRA